MLGSIFVVIALLASLYSIYKYYQSYRGEQTLQKARIGYHVMSVSVIGASVVLLYLIINHQFQYNYVFNYSSSDLSFGLLLSTFFAGQEGSFLLWVLFAVIIGLFLMSRYVKSGKSEATFMLGFIPTVTFILVMISPLLKNPFAYIWSNTAYIDTKFLNSSLLNTPALQNFLLTDSNNQRTVLKFGEELINSIQYSGIQINQLLIQGKGLNPMLENFWMQIHPPVLFLGFALAAVPFAYAVSSLIKNEYQTWIKETLPWVIATVLVLGLGIMIGGYWAYGVLGWGGYWAWDPVENSSLVPWIIAVALLHTMLIQKKSGSGNKPGGFIKTNLLLAGFTFVLVVYSTFLTRSGILSDTSVHSFTDPGILIYNVLFGFLIMFSIGVVGLVFYRRREIEAPAKSEHNLFSREIGLFYGSMLLIGSVFAIIVGTSAPIFGQTVHIEFYTMMNLPLVVLMCLLIPLSLYLDWRSNDSRLFFKRTITSLSISITLTVLLTILIGTNELLYILLVFAAVFTIVTNTELILRSNKNIKLLGGHLAHIGFAIFIIGALVSVVLDFDQELELEKGKVYDFENTEVSFNGYQPIENGKKYLFDVKLKNESGYEAAKPVMYISDYNNSLMREPYIITGISKDIYIEPLSFEPGNSTSKQVVSLRKGKPFEVGGAYVTFEGFDLPEDAMQKMMKGESFDVHAKISVGKGGNSNVKDVLLVKGVTKRVYDETTNISFDITNYDVAGILQIKFDSQIQNVNITKDILTVKISEKPFISFVWIGIIVMALGFTLVYIRRFLEVKN